LFAAFSILRFRACGDLPLQADKKKALRGTRRQDDMVTVKHCGVQTR
jgi:hypothetical protein